ncbi:MAG TPA: trypsin-like peptidase domain-containing protein [Candidatus Angelobacter sp.]|jgi:hypothetical protein|nr:trypsin-like peptidase domain-containing protein [Candidatus Angelobacter sp.]
MGVIASSVVQAMPRPAGLQGLRFDVRIGARQAALALLLAATLGSALAAASAAEEQTMLGVAAAHRSSLALVVACAPGGTLGNCRSSTAFSVAPGVFVTASHALLGTEQVTLSTLSHGSAVGRVEQIDVEGDLAVLRSSLVLPALHTAPRAVAGEDAVVVCSRRAIADDGAAGRPANYVGRVGGAPIRVDQGSQQLLLERVAGAASVLGCSGSPVLDRSGAVTGVLVGGDGASAGMVDSAELDRVLGDGR